MAISIKDKLNDLTKDFDTIMKNLNFITAIINDVQRKINHDIEIAKMTEVNYSIILSYNIFFFYKIIS